MRKNMIRKFSVTFFGYCAIPLTKAVFIVTL